MVEKRNNHTPFIFKGKGIIEIINSVVMDLMI